jgi:lipopolysaccharide/colanic/teichoic acid biosynthesis glycosyltransferase
MLLKVKEMLYNQQVQTDAAQLTGGLSIGQRFLKRSFDVLVSVFGLIVFGWLILLGWLAATLDTGLNGFFTQSRVGRYGKTFKVIKLRTMKVSQTVTTTVTTKKDPRITRLGALLRKTKIDELPQLINVLLGQMSLVGPRPDVPGYADRLEGSDRIVLTIRPGITGPASLKYRHEEEILAAQANPERYNREVIFVDKVRINREYVEKYNFFNDLKYIWQTAFGD